MLHKQNRLTTNKQYDTVYKNGKKYRGEYGMLICYTLGDNPPLFGIVVNNKLGKAVKRQKLKRRIRAIIREGLQKHGSKLNGKQYSYIAYKYPDSYTSLEKELVKQIQMTLEVTTSTHK